MKVIAANGYRRVFPKVKVSGVYKTVPQAFVNVAGQWKLFIGELPKGNIYSGTITVGHGTLEGLELYGYHHYATGSAASPNVTKQNRGIYVITESKPFAGTGQYQWIEMCIQSDNTDIPFKNCSLNGLIGELVSFNYNVDQDVTYIRWAFAAPLPLSGTWNFVV